MSKRQYSASLQQIEKAWLLSAHPDRDEASDLLGELTELAKTMGAEVIGESIQKRNLPDPKSYLGKGAIESLKEELDALTEESPEHAVTMIIADDELSPRQQKALEELLELPVLDRTLVILEIFANRAASREGKIQVELARLQYLLPRLTGRGTAFSQQVARSRTGLATRGPGETQLEFDRRHLRRQIQRLEREAKAVQKHRSQQRQKRVNQNIPLIALVGYTNAGKSTLMNTLTQAKVLAEDKLFATLDPTVRRLIRPNFPACLLMDTVGFIQKLPTFLIKSFQATLEEIETADLILHVIDLSHPLKLRHFEVVQETLEALGCQDIPQLIVWNKIDTFSLKQFEIEKKFLENHFANYSQVFISAKSKEDFGNLFLGIESILNQHVTTN